MNNESPISINQDALIKAMSIAFEKVLSKKTISIGTLNDAEINQKDEYLSQKEACKFLSIHQSTIIRWRKENLIPFHRIGKSIMYSKNEIIVFARAKVNWK